MKQIFLFLLIIFVAIKPTFAYVEYGPDGRKIYTHLCDELSSQDPEYQECLIERDYFSQFEPSSVKHFSSALNCTHPKINTDKMEDFMIILGFFLEKTSINIDIATPLIQNILVKILDHSTNMDQKCFLQELLNYYFGKKPQVSKLNFSDIYQSIQSHKIQSRSVNYTEYEEFYEAINAVFATPRSEYGVGEYLFSNADGETPKLFGLFPEKNYQAVRILKAGDTHRQEFAQIKSDQDLMATLAIKNKKLQIQLTTEDFEDSLYVGPNLTFQLNQDRSRSLISCTEKNKKTGISTCDNPKISITTTLK